MMCHSPLMLKPGSDGKAFAYVSLIPWKDMVLKAHWIYSVDTPLFLDEIFFFVTQEPRLICLIRNRTICYCKTCLETCFMGQSTHQREYDCSAASLSVCFSDIMLIAFQSLLTHCCSKTQGKWYWMGYTCTEFLLSICHSALLLGLYKMNDFCCSTTKKCFFSFSNGHPEQLWSTHYCDRFLH